MRSIISRGPGLRPVDQISEMWGSPESLPELNYAIARLQIVVTRSPMIAVHAKSLVVNTRPGGQFDGLANITSFMPACLLNRNLR